MSTINTLLYNILLKNHDFCCICLKTIERDPTTIEDELVLNENLLKIRDVLSLVIGYDVSKYPTLTT